MKLHLDASGPEKIEVRLDPGDELEVNDDLGDRLKTATSKLRESGGDSKPPAAPTSSASEPPAKSDNKPKWVAYAESIGIDTDGLTKAEIIEKVEESE